MLRSGSCKLCGDAFNYEYSTGRPRVYCFTCEPDGYAVVTRPNGRRKLRRIHPVVKRADLELLWGRKPPAA
jgi:hypothetical protein